MIIQGDCLKVMQGMESESVDSIVTDPPYGLSKEPNVAEVLYKWLRGEPYDHGHGGFMGKSWDSFVPHPDVWKEAYRVLKPGGYALVFAGTRTQDLMTIALRLAGFEVRDVIEWLYFSGFPKSMDVGKAFDKRNGAEREVIREGFTSSDEQGNTYAKGLNAGFQPRQITAPSTDLAKQWDGWGTALKPAHEPIIVVRKPLIGTVADNVEKYGTGGINVDGCRIVTGEPRPTGLKKDGTRSQRVGNEGWDRPWKHGEQRIEPNAGKSTELGRFPANCITTDEDAFYSPYFNVSPQEVSKKASKKDRNANWAGHEIGLDAKQTTFWQTGNGTSGKPSSLALTREDGSEKKIPEYKNNHPTVKPTDLMAWLVRLVTPPGGTVLDPFAGSGSTLVAARREGFDTIGIEQDAEYVNIAKARIKAEQTTLFQEMIK